MGIGALDDLRLDAGSSTECRERLFEDGFLAVMVSVHKDSPFCTSFTLFVIHEQVRKLNKISLPETLWTLNHRKQGGNLLASSGAY
jgi:hypothetical protein